MINTYEAQSYEELIQEEQAFDYFQNEQDAEMEREKALIAGLYASGKW